MGTKLREKRRWKKWFPFSWRDSLVMLGILFVCLIICNAFLVIEPEFSRTSMIFLFAVCLVSRFTTGYLYGILASLISVLLVNYFFTEPFGALNFTMSGYPLSIGCMLVVAITTGALTTQIKRQGEMRLATEKEKMRGNLLRAVSHDLRTPLTAIMGASSALLENGETIPIEEREELLRGINDEAQWLVRMVENLLSVTRINEDGKANIHKTEGAAEEIIADAVAKFKKRYQGCNVSVQVPKEYIQVSVDHILIEQVIINLMENVVQHAGGTKNLELVLTRHGKKAVFEVIDDGNGIKEWMLPRIFDGSIYHDYGMDGDNRRNMGIGLSVCQTIVKAHGGEISAINKKNPEHGAIFRFDLPISMGESGNTGRN